MDSANREHTYQVAIEWTGNRGMGTSDYRSYGREHLISAGKKPSIEGSSDSSFRGDVARWNPEDLFIASLSGCHQLWYLHLCAINGISVLAYSDEATGTMKEDTDRGGYFTHVLLRPRVKVRSTDDVDLAERLHMDAHHKCFIANSVNFPVEHEALVERAVGENTPQVALR